MLSHNSIHSYSHPVEIVPLQHPGEVQQGAGCHYQSKSTWYLLSEPSISLRCILNRTDKIESYSMCHKKALRSHEQSLNPPSSLRIKKAQVLQREFISPPRFCTLISYTLWSTALKAAADLKESALTLETRTSAGVNPCSSIEGNGRFSSWFSSISGRQSCMFFHRMKCTDHYTKTAQGALPAPKSLQTA